jgi:hypothetical protein
MEGAGRKTEDDNLLRPPSFVLHRFYFATTFALDNQYIPVHDCSMFVTPAATSGCMPSGD